MMEKAITEILYLVSMGRDLEVALHTVLSRYTLTSNEHALMCREESWREDLAAFIRRKLIEGRGAKSLKNYSFVITCAMESINKPTADVTAEDVQMYLLYKKNVCGCSDKYVHDIRTKLNVFFDWARKSDIIRTNPVDGVAQIKVRKKHVKAFTDEEVERMRRACENGRNRTRDRAMFELLLSSGMRCAELIALDISDINLSEREGTIRHGKGDKERTFYFSTVAAMYLREYLASYNGTDGALFVSERTKRRFGDDSSVEQIVKRWGEAGGVIGATPHRFRHTFITRCIDKGISVENTKLLAGHENIDTTMGYYDENHEKAKQEHSRICA